MGFNRRKFIQYTGKLSGMLLFISHSPKGLSHYATPIEGAVKNPQIPAKSWMDGPGKAKYRFEGMEKVTGQKVFGVDFRSKDLPGWPQQESRAMIIGAHVVDQVFEGFDFSSLDPALHPSRSFTSQDMDKYEWKIPDFFPGILMTKVGEGAEFLGQPLGILLFDDLDTFHRFSSQYGMDSKQIALYGKKVHLPSPASFAHERVVKYMEDGKLLFSSATEEVWIKPPYPKANATGNKAAQGIHYAEKIREEMRKKTWKVVEGDFSTQTIDPMFMEPEGGLGWYDAKEKKLKIVMGTQSPYSDADKCGYLLSGKKSAVEVKGVDFQCCYVGGGFGGKDHSQFALYLAIAAAMNGGKPVRLVNSRYDQFQTGIKRHSSKIHEAIALDSEGKLQALAAELHYKGGGRINFSWAVPVVGADNAASGYHIPKADIELTCMSSVGVTAGSMRGFGTLESQFAIESLMDAAAEQLKIDPIALRMKNAMTPQFPTIRGARVNNNFYVKELLQTAQNHPLWKSRDKIREKNDANTLYGVGFALGMKSFGTTRDVVLAQVKLLSDGTIELKTNYIDMGNGSATSLAIACAEYLGQNATSLHLGALEDFTRLQQTEVFCTEQKQLDELSRDPRFTPEVNMGTAASASAFFIRHGVLEASKLLFEFGILPSAKKLWNTTEEIDPAKCFWKDTQLHYPNLEPIAPTELAQELYRSDLPVTITVHGYYQGEWAQASFEFMGKIIEKPIDALGYELPSGKFFLLNRTKVQFPPVKNNFSKEDRFAPCGAICAVAVDKKSGEIKVTEMQSFIDCGPIIQQDIVEGQSEGAVAMGIGNALYEFLPEDLGGAGEGGWNLHRYHPPLPHQVPYQTQKLHIIPPLDPDDKPKGIGEVVLNPIIPSISNALYHATGHRFRDLPITPEKIKAALG